MNLAFIWCINYLMHYFYISYFLLCALIAASSADFNRF
jgi:hypothetical protein